MREADDNAGDIAARHAANIAARHAAHDGDHTPAHHRAAPRAAFGHQERPRGGGHLLRAGRPGGDRRFQRDPVIAGIAGAAVAVGAGALVLGRRRRTSSHR